MTTGRWRARRECAAIAAALLLFVRCSSATKPPRETVFASSALTRLATAAAQREREEWDWIRTWQMDVDGFDPKSECVGTEAARKFFVVPNWYPNLPVKCTLCGDVKRYELFDGFGNEADWNIYLAPHKPFKYLFGGRSQSWHFVDGTQCMEAEVTPRRGLYDNRWFPYRKPADYRPPPTVCVYGPG